MSRLQELMSIKEDFGSMIDRIQPWILSHFVMWLDLKIAEYKVYGYMMLDENGFDGLGHSAGRSSQSPDLSPLARSTPPKRRQGVQIVPKPLSPKNIQSSISRRYQAEKDGHFQTMNSLFLNSFPKKQGAERNYLQRNETSLSPEKSVVHTDIHVPSVRQLQTNIDERSDMYLGFVPNPDSQDHRFSDRSTSGMKRPATASPDSNQSLTHTNTSGSSRHQENDTETTALYKSQQFSTLISDSRPQKLDLIDRWNGGEKSGSHMGPVDSNDTEGNQMLKNVTVIDLADGSQGQSEHCSSTLEKEYFQESNNKLSVNLEVSTDNSQTPQPSFEEDGGHPSEQSNSNIEFDLGSQPTKEETGDPPVVIKIESDGEDLANMMQSENTPGAMSLEESSSDISNFKSLYMDDGSLPMTTGSNSGSVVPVELVPHGNLPSMSLNEINLTLSQGMFTKKRRYVRTKPFASSPSCVPRDPISGKFVCTICNGKFQNRSSFFRHKSLHGEKRLQCFVCLKRFHRKEHASMHMNRHGKNGELICPICQMVGHDTGEMEQHFCIVHKVRSMYTYRIQNDIPIQSLPYTGQTFSELDNDPSLQIFPVQNFSSDGVENDSSAPVTGT